MHPLLTRRGQAAQRAWAVQWCRHGYARIATHPLLVKRAQATPCHPLAGWWWLVRRHPPMPRILCLQLVQVPLWMQHRQLFELPTVARAVPLRAHSWG